MTQKRAMDIAGAAPLGKLHYTLLFWCSFIMLFDGYDLVIYGAVVPRLMEEWALTPVVAGWMGSAALFGMMFGAVAVGPQADRLGRRKVIIGSIGLASLCALGTAFTWNAPSFALARFLTGVGLGGAIPNIVALMNDLAPTARRSSLTTIMLSFYSVGAMISALVAMLIIPRYGWEATFIIGGLPLLFLPWLARQLPESLHYLLEKDRTAASELLTRIDPQVDTRQVNLDAPVRSSTAAPLSRLFTEGRGVGTLFLWLGFGMCLLMVYGLNTWLPKIMVAGGFELGSSLMFLVTLNIGATAGALGGGWLADRWGLQTDADAVLPACRGVLVHFGHQARPCAVERDVADCRGYHHWHLGGNSCLRCPAIPQRNSLHRRQLVLGHRPLWWGRRPRARRVDVEHEPAAATQLHPLRGAWSDSDLRHRDDPQGAQYGARRAWAGIGCSILIADVLSPFSRHKGAAMKIAIVGAGAMGGLFGARLVLAGQEVSFVEASGHAIEVISCHGLRLETPDAQTTVQVPIARAEQFSGFFDLLVIFTKGFHTAAAIDSVRHLVGPDTWALSVQNGLGNADLIAEVIPTERVIVGMTNLPADLVAPGVVHSQGEGHINLWSFDGEDASRVHEVAAVLSQAGLPCTADPQVQVAIWEKVAFNAALNSVCAVTRQTVGAVGDCAHGRQVLSAIIEETLAVARAAGIAVDRQRVEVAMDYAVDNHRQHKPSMLQDLEAGQKTEIDFINGAVVAHGKRVGVPTPVSQALYDLIKISENRD